MPHELSRELLLEMMAFLGCRPVDGSLAGLFFDDLQFEGGDTGAITWGGEIADEVKADSPVLVIGCGMAGILAGIRLKQAGLPFTIVDKNPGPGGTWWENRYPGARVDVGSHQYCYSFEPADHWSEFYCQQPELRAYFTSTVDKFGLRPHCRFDTTVTKLRWDDEHAGWIANLGGADGTEEIVHARFVISAVGSLNIPKLPDIPGMDLFTGPSFHSARWPEGLPLAGTRFALVGAGASGFQIGPAIADQVERLTIFQRTAQWIIPNPLYHAPVPPGDKWALRHLPFYGRWYRFIMTFAGIAAGVDFYRIDPTHEDPTGRSVNAVHAKRANALLGWMTSLIAERPDLAPKVVPDYPALGKRVLQDDGSWLRCLQQPNVELVRTAIDRIVPDGVLTVDGTHYAADVICYATGFRHNDYLASMDLTGRDGTVPARPVGRRTDRLPRHHHPELPEPVLRVRPRDQPRGRRQPLLPLRVPGPLRHGGHPRDARLRRAALRSHPRGPRLLRPAVPGRDRPARVVPPIDRAQPLQEPRRQGLHAVAVAPGPLLGVDPSRRP